MTSVPTNPAAASSSTWDVRRTHKVPHDSSYYAKCMIGGVLSCGLTHTAVCPLDVVKCNMQVDPKTYTGLMTGLKILINDEGYGAAGIWKGWLPTLYGYSMQGLFKFGIYEILKDEYSNLAGERHATVHQGKIWLAASASAEFVADVALCPMEMLKVKMQTSPKGTFPTKLAPAFSAIVADKSAGFPLGSVKALWSRQIPYTMTKFYFFERVVRIFYAYVFTAPKDTYGKSTQLAITFASGYIAGVACAVVSHPADMLVSLKGKRENSGKTFGQIIKEVGWPTLCTKGLGTRILMVGTLTGLQWWIYDSYKTLMGLGSSGK